MVPMQPWKRPRSYFVRGRCRVPFEGYRRARRAGTSEPGGRADETAYPAAHFANDLTAAQARLVQQRLTLALRRRRQQGRPCKGPWLAAMLAGIVPAVKQGRVGNSAWGWRMHGQTRRPGDGPTRAPQAAGTLTQGCAGVGRR